MNLDQDMQSTVEDEISLLDLLRTVVENLKLLILGSLSAGLLALIISFLITPTFTAKTTILPPSSPSGVSALAGLLGDAGGLVGAAAGLKDPAQQYVAYLKSDALRNALIEKFELQKKYELEYLEHARKALDGRVRISSEKQSGLIAIEVDDIDPQFAAQLANAHVEQLRLLTARLALQEASDRREFLEKQLQEISARPVRDLFTQQALMSSMIRQYEAARIDEQRTGPTFSQVDKAVPPELKSKPKKALIAVLVTLASGFLLLLFVFVRQAWRQSDQDPETHQKIADIKRIWQAQKFWLKK